MSKRIQIIIQNCKRCGKPVAGASRAIHGSESMRKKYAGICSSCSTADERNEILMDQLKGILNEVKK